MAEFEIADEVFEIPGANIISADSVYTSWERPNDVKTDRLQLDVNGHDVQILRYDFDPYHANVMIDGGRIDVIPFKDVNEYIKRNT